MKKYYKIGKFEFKVFPKDEEWMLSVKYGDIIRTYKYTSELHALAEIGRFAETECELF